MEAQKASRLYWLASVNLIIGILNLLIILMLISIMSSDSYKILLSIFGESIGGSLISVSYLFGFVITFPLGILTIIVGIISARQCKGNKSYRRIAVASIIVGVLGMLLGTPTWVIYNFFRGYLI